MAGKEPTICGIAGASLHPDEKVNANRLARYLLLGIEHRGTDATGCAWRMDTGGIVTQKRDVAASLFVKQLSVPRKAQTFICHTRYATQGHPIWPENNHPIQTQNLVGVHNGMVANDDSLFRRIGTDRRRGQVDSEAIFALLDYGVGVDKPGDVQALLPQVYGSAAIAWMSLNESVEVLNLARLRGSPLVVAMTKAGSLLFASEKDAVLEAAARARLDVTWCEALSEGEYYRVKAGMVTDLKEFKVPHSYYRSYTPAWQRGSTSNPKWDHCSGCWEQVDACDCPASLENARTADDWAKADRSWMDKVDKETGEVRAAKPEPTVIEDDDALADVLAMQRPAYDEPRGQWANVLIEANSLFCGHNVQRPADAEWAARFYRRIDNMDRWAENLNRNLDHTQVESIGVRAHAHLRPGDWVQTTLLGTERWAQVVDVPDTFPTGEYLLRVIAPRINGDGDADAVEPLLVRRKGHEFINHGRRDSSEFLFPHLADKPAEYIEVNGEDENGNRKPVLVRV